jgi:hypothetical protein
MSYSRWSNSVWYTYADVNGGFTVCGERNFTDSELEDIEACLGHFKDRYDAKQIEELRGYMTDYVGDFPPGSRNLEAKKP